MNNLLLSGACARAKNKSGSRPLHYAVIEGHLGVVKLLLKAGASPDSRRKVGDEKFRESVEKMVEKMSSNHEALGLKESGDGCSCTATARASTYLLVWYSSTL